MTLIKATCMAVLGTALIFNQQLVSAADMSHGANNFYQSNQVNVKKVHFKNIYGMDVVGTLFTPKSMDLHKKYATLVLAIPS